MFIAIIDWQPDPGVTILTGTDAHAIRREAILAMTRTEPGNDPAWTQLLTAGEEAKVLQACPFPDLDDPERVQEWHARLRTTRGLPRDLPQFTLHEPAPTNGDTAQPTHPVFSLDYFLD